MASMQFKEELRQIIKDTPGNELCVDCREPSPTWASVNLGIFMCLACSGVHRAMGVHISFVKSTTLDKWTPQLVANMRNGGNTRANKFFEATLPPNHPRPRTMRDREEFIRAKYEHRKWIRKAGDAPVTEQEDQPEEDHEAAPSGGHAGATAGRKKRIPPSQRRLMQQQQQQSEQPAQSSAALDDSNDANLLGEHNESQIGGQGQGAPVQQPVASLFQNMSIKVKDGSAAPAPPNGAPAPSDKAAETNPLEDLLSFGASSPASAAQGASFAQFGGASAAGEGSNGAFALANFGIAPVAPAATAQPLGNAESILSQFGAAQAPAFAPGALDVASDFGMAGAGPSIPTGASGVAALEQIRAEIAQVQGELEQAKVNLQMYVQAKETLISTKNRLEQLSGHVDVLQMQRLDGIQGLDHQLLGVRKQLNTQATALASQISTVHSSMLAALLGSGH